MKNTTVSSQVRRLQTIPVQSGIRLADVGRQTKPHRRSWTDTLKEMVSRQGSVVIAKEARSSIAIAAKRLGISIRTQEIDPYHVRATIAA